MTLKNEIFVPAGDVEGLLDLDVSTGHLFWKRRDSTLFRDTIGKSRSRTAAHAAANWNSHYAGKRAMTATQPSGHLSGRIFDRTFRAHRVVFAISRGQWPKQSIDHINGNPSDNRPENLRDVSHQENHRNQKNRKNNTSGVIGVSFNRRLCKWQASITIDYRSVHIGFFEEKKDAINARIASQIEAGFHDNHGRSAA